MRNEQSNSTRYRPSQVQKYRPQGNLRIQRRWYQPRYLLPLQKKEDIRHRLMKHRLGLYEFR